MVASSDRPRSLRRRRRWSQERLMVAVMVVASLGLVGTWGVSAWQGASEEEAAEEVAAELDPEPIVEEAVNWHRRDLPVDVVGPSDKRVKRWFDGKVNFPVRLPRFDRERPGEVNLLGARLSNVRDRQAAYVVYEANGSKLSVMVFNRNPRIKTIRRDVARRPIYFKNAGGYNVAVVEDNGVTYSITSELPEHEMVQLVDAAFKEGSR
ncbi:MAG: hypothetical protein CMH57_04540 [Myxococcales bacterium]|nr:hypothetical protein [Myxococcales bacterium]